MATTIISHTCKLVPRFIPSTRLLLPKFNFLQACFNSGSSEMQTHEVVPDVIPISPEKTIKITYPSGVTVNLGNELTPTQVKDIPSLSWENDEKAFYLLCMIDPDAPSRKDPKLRECNHWLVGNIPGDMVEKGETLIEYIGSGPPEGTDLHRYVFLVYRQPGKLTFDEKRVTNRSRDNRANFKITEFAKKYKLNNPVAGNFYLAAYDDYVPILHKQLGL